jgi:hypothetical protein
MSAAEITCSLDGLLRPSVSGTTAGTAQPRRRDVEGSRCESIPTWSDTLTEYLFQRCCRYRAIDDPTLQVNFIGPASDKAIGVENQTFSCHVWKKNEIILPVQGRNVRYRTEPYSLV